MHNHTFVHFFFKDNDTGDELKLKRLQTENSTELEKPESLKPFKIQGCLEISQQMNKNDQHDIQSQREPQTPLSKPKLKKINHDELVESPMENLTQLEIGKS